MQSYREHQVGLSDTNEETAMKIHSLSSEGNRAEVRWGRENSGGIRHDDGEDNDECSMSKSITPRPCDTLAYCIKLQPVE